MDEIRDSMKLPEEFVLSLDTAGKQPLKPSKATVASQGLQHGTQVFVSYARDFSPPIQATGTSNNAIVPVGHGEPIDEMLEKQDGLIKRSRDARLYVPHSKRN
jgi:hypothetical protein